ncbi:MAG: PKD domain-containing protein [Marinifilaceae bacterium]|jgi:PKD repeat protein|nr:PKD domain-containing protein [Marinifilaceae bacterium]
MKKLLLLFIFSQIFCISKSQVEKKVLFLGNSYTSYNNLPEMVKLMAESSGDKLTYDKNTPGGCNLQNHANSQVNHDKINSKDWDYVVIQAQSQELSWGEDYNTGTQYDYINNLYNKIKTNNANSDILFYMTWGRKYGDINNCNNFPWTCTYEGMDEAIRTAYLNMAKYFHSSVSPVSVVWREIINNHHEINLYYSDDNHPSKIGSYTAACCFYTMIFNKDPKLIDWDSDIDSSITNTIKEITNRLVYQNITDWSFKNTKPIAKYNFTINKDELNIENISQNADEYYWNFGDGSFSYEKKPRKIYNSTGEYDVSLKVKSGNIENKITQKIKITELADFDVNFTYEIIDHKIYLTNKSDNIETCYWDFGDNSHSSEYSPEHNYQKPNNYIVSLTGFRGSRSITVEKEIEIKNRAPFADFSYTINKYTISLSNKSEYYDSCLWDFGDGNISKEQNPIHKYAKHGNYSVKLDIKKNSIVKSITKNIIIEKTEDPIADFSYTIKKNNITLTNKSINYDECIWTIDNKSESRLNNLNISFDTAGEHEIKLKVLRNNKSDYKVIIVQIPELKPLASYTYKTDINYVTFTNNSSNYNSCLWIFGDGEESKIVNPTHRYIKPGTYKVELKVYKRTKTESIIKEILISIPLSVNKIKAYECKIFKTNKNHIKIHLDKVYHKTLINIIDINGKVHFSNTYHNHREIEISNNFNTGIYIININTEGFKNSKKMIIK